MSIWHVPIDDPAHGHEPEGRPSNGSEIDRSTSRACLWAGRINERVGSPAVFLLVDGVHDQPFKSARSLREQRLSWAIPEFRHRRAWGDVADQHTAADLIPRILEFWARFYCRATWAAQLQHTSVLVDRFSRSYSLRQWAHCFGAASGCGMANCERCCPFGRFRDLDRSSCMAMQHHSGQE